jgi:hypothetical protein
MRKKNDIKTMREVFINNLTREIQNLMRIKAAAEFGTLKQMRNTICSPKSELQKFVRWAIIPSGLLYDLKLHKLLDKERKKTQ